MDINFILGFVVLLQFADHLVSLNIYNFTRFSVNFLITFSQKNDPGFSLKGKPFLLVVLGDFNAKLSPWHDKDSSTSERISVEIICHNLDNMKQLMSLLLT